MKKIVFFAVNVIAILILSVLYFTNRNSIADLRVNYSYSNKGLDDLISEYQDSTKGIRKYFNGLEISEYAKSIDNDSIRNFVIVQGGQWDYFFAYQNDLRVMLNILERQIIERDTVNNVLLIVCFVSVLFNVLFFMYYMGSLKNVRHL